jgi:exo-beta-1,3-glucanase (GH17 family)
MKRLATLVMLGILSLTGLWPGVYNAADAPATLEEHCVAFSPYVDSYSPFGGPHPPPELIDELLDAVQAAGFECILTYGMLNGLDYTFEAAESRGMKVLAGIWLDGEATADNASITEAIQEALAYPETITRLSCGIELRTRHGAANAEAIIGNCLTQLRAAGVTQPVTSIDTWWSWCNETWPCAVWALADDVDWIGVNIYPWWENRFSGLFPCTEVGQAAGFTLNRLEDIMARYPSQTTILTEFGWPAGPEGYRETNIHTGQECGEAGEDNQRRVIEETLTGLEELGMHAVVFEGFRENWKGATEGVVGPYWGICSGTASYKCTYAYGLRMQIYLPQVEK